MFVHFVLCTSVFAVCSCTMLKMEFPHEKVGGEFGVFVFFVSYIMCDDKYLIYARVAVV